MLIQLARFSLILSRLYTILIELCTFIGGEILGGKEERIGATSTEQDCASLVISLRPTATGASWTNGGQRSSGLCYAEFGDRIKTIVQSVLSLRSCFFNHGI